MVDWNAIARMRQPTLLMRESEAVLFLKHAESGALTRIGTGAGFEIVRVPDFTLVARPPRNRKDARRRVVIAQRRRRAGRPVPTHTRRVPSVIPPGQVIAIDAALPALEPMARDWLDMPPLHRAFAFEPLFEPLFGRAQFTSIFSLATF